MSKLRLIGLSLVVLSLTALGGTNGAGASTKCLNIITYGTNPATGECREFPNPCSVPSGWIKSYSPCPS